MQQHINAPLGPRLNAVPSSDHLVRARIVLDAIRARVAAQITAEDEAHREATGELWLLRTYALPIPDFTPTVITSTDDFARAAAGAGLLTTYQPHRPARADRTDRGNLITRILRSVAR